MWPYFYINTIVCILYDLGAVWLLPHSNIHTVSEVILLFYSFTYSSKLNNWDRHDMNHWTTILISCLGNKNFTIQYKLMEMLENEENSGSGYASRPGQLDNGITIQDCGKCQLCINNLDTSLSHTSNVTGKTFVLPSKVVQNKIISCTTTHVIYLMTCRCCNLQYVGKTIQPLKKRMYNHKSNMHAKTVNTFLYKHYRKADHFREGVEHFNKVKVQIIDYLDDNDKSKTNNNSILEGLEEFHMKRLISVYPFGLNDKITSSNDLLTKIDLTKFNVINTVYFQETIPRKSRSHGNRNRQKKSQFSFNVDNFIRDTLALTKRTEFNRLYTLLRSTKIKDIKTTRQVVLQRKDTILTNQLYIDIILAYSSQYEESLEKRVSEKGTIYVKLPFIHKVMDDIRVQSIINNKKLKHLLPAATYDTQPKLVYTYGDTIGKLLFNYNKVLKEISEEDIVNKIPCDCESNPELKSFVYDHYGHVFTGNLDIVTNKEVKNIMKKGAKYRETPYTNYKEVYELVTTALDELTMKWSKKCNIDKDNLGPWLEEVKNIVKKRIMTLKDNGAFKTGGLILKKSNNLEYIRKLQDRFVIVPIDKAGNNFAVICKSLYLSILLKELGFHENMIQGNDVYEVIEITQEELIEKHKQILKQFGIRMSKINNYVPNLYWTAKLHKNPYKSRFIAGAAKSTMKQLSKELALVLKAVKCRFSNYCNKIEINTGYSVYWSVDNSKEVVDKLKRIKAKSIQTFDFSTLYTNIPLDQIYQNLEELITKMFGVQGTKLASEIPDIVQVSVSRKKQFWSKKEYSSYKSYDLAKTLEALRVIIYNNHVKCGTYLFHQKQGIPMGDNCSPFLADLYLSWLEYKYMMNLIKTDKGLARKLSNNCRFQDDIQVINYLGFDRIAKEIYPKELILENTNENTSHDTFLDLSITVHNEKFVIGVFHKTDHYNFEVTSFCFADSNISENIGYNTFYSQLIRFSRICTTLENFEHRAHLTYTKLLSRGFSLPKLLKVYQKFISKCRQLLINEYGKLPNITLMFDLKDRKTSEHTISDKNNEKIINEKEDRSQFIETQTREQVNTVALLGLPNIGNSCYMNSIISCLIGMNIKLKIDKWQLTNIDKDSYTSSANVVQIIRDLVIGRYDDKATILRNLKLTLSETDEFFKSSRQQDAHEAMNKLLSIMDKGTSSEIAEDIETSVLQEHITMVNTCTNTCLSCNYANKYSVRQVELMVPVERNLHQAIQKTLNSEVTKLCSNCKSNTKHKTQQIITSPPKILVIAIKRFDNNNQKIHKIMNIPEKLKVGTSQGSLSSFIQHYGNVNSGHYTAVVKMKSKWYKCDDSVVYTTEPKSELKSSYILCYTF